MFPAGTCETFFFFFFFYGSQKSKKKFLPCTIATTRPPPSHSGSSESPLHFMTCFAVGRKAMFSDALIVSFCFLFFSPCENNIHCCFRASSIWSYMVLVARSSEAPMLATPLYHIFQLVLSTLRRSVCYFHPVFVIFHFFLNECVQHYSAAVELQSGRTVRTGLI